MQDLFLSPIPFEKIKSELSDTIKKELQSILLVLKPHEQTEFLTRKEAANLLSISLPTLNEWTKEGKVIGYRIASRVRYKRSELETSLKQISTSKKERRAA